MRHAYLKGTFVWCVFIFMLFGVLPSMAAAVDRGLLVQDALAWDSDANTQALDYLGVSYDTTTSDMLATTDLTQYKVVIYPSDQPQAFYDTVAAALPQIESFVAQGGILVAHAAADGWNGGTWSELDILPSGMSAVEHMSEEVFVYIPEHPAFAEAISIDPDYFAKWGYSVHGYFTDVPFGGVVVAESDAGPVYVDYAYGRGRILAGMFTVEYKYGSKPEFLRNELYAAFSSAPIAVGTVTDLDSDAPIEGAWLNASLIGEEWSWVSSSSSGVDGSYSLWDVTNSGGGIYSLEAMADGYIYLGQEVEWNGTDSLALDFALTKADTIVAGTVYDARTEDPVASAYLTAFLVDDGEWLWAGDTTSAADGTYTLCDETLSGHGDYEFRAWADGYFEGGASGTWDGAALSRDIVLDPVPRIASGIVYNAYDGPIYRATVTAYKVEESARYWAGEAYTDINGEFILFDWESGGAGEYELEAAADSFVSTTQSYTWDGVDEVYAEFFLADAATLVEGLVSDVVTTAALKEAYIDAYRYIEDLGEYEWIGWDVSDFEGYYHIYDARAAGAGTYLLTADCYGYIYQSWEGDWGGGEPLYVDFELALAPAVATGSVTDASTSDPISDACIEMLRYNVVDEYWETVAGTWTLEDGIYTLLDRSSYGPGEYRFAVSARGYIKAEVTQTWDGETPLTIDFALEAREIALDAYEPDNTPAQAKIILTNGTLQEHTLCLAGDSDWMTFFAEAGVVYTIETSMLDWAETDTWLSLYESDGKTLIDENDDVDWGLYSRIEWTAPADMNVYIRVTELGENLGDYRISVSGADGSVISVSGTDRFSTGVEASKLAYPDGANTVIIATGRNWPDALGGTALAGALNGPILLVDTNVLPTSVSDEIERLGASEAIILGGPSAVGTAVETALNTDLGDANVDRIAGGSRYETADLVALRTIEVLGVDYDGTAFVATGGNFPDALAAAPLAAAQGWPLYLANPKTGLAAATKTAMADVQSVLILGGTTVVTPATEIYLTGEYGVDFVTRLAGGDRYTTAIAIATYAVEEAGHVWDRVGITTGTNFPDALAGGVLQGQAGSVMLLTKSSELNTDVEATLSTNKASITTVTFFGGTNAVQQTVRDAVVAALAADI